MTSKNSSYFQSSDHLILTLKEKFLNIQRVLYEVDPKEADRFQTLNHHYFEKYHQHNETSKDKQDSCNKNHEHKHNEGHKKTGCQGHDHDELNRKFFIPEKERSFIHQLLYERLKDYKLKEVLPEILNDLAQKFENIKKGGIKDKLEWTEETEKFVLSKVLTEGFTKALANQIKKEIQRDLHVDSKQPLLLATPQSWYERFPKVKLDFLQSNTIAGLLEKGYSVQQNFVEESGFPQTLAYEVMYFYHEGRFESPSFSEEEQRNDKALVFHLSDIDPKTSKNLYHVCKLLTALPFEFNLKANIYAQAAENFQLSYFDKEGFQKIHYDSSFQEKHDNGKKISALYVFSSQSNTKKPKLTLYKEQSRDVHVEMELELGTVTLLKSRVFPYALSEIPPGTFVLRYWINGPADKNQFTM